MTPFHKIAKCTLFRLHQRYIHATHLDIGQVQLEEENAIKMSEIHNKTQFCIDLTVLESDLLEISKFHHPEVSILSVVF